MTNLFTYLSNWKLKYVCALVVLLCLGVGTAWGGESTYTMKTTGSGSTAIETNWTANTAATFNSSGAYWGCSATTNTFTITSGAGITGTITQVQVTGKRNKDMSYTIDCTVGGSALGSQYSHGASSGNYDTDDTFYNSTGLTGTIVITAVCAGGSQTAKKGSFWITDITVTTASATTYTIYLPNTVSSCNTTGSFTSNQGTLGSGTGGWTGYKTYSGITAGTSVTITATPESGYSFDGWTDGGYSIIVDDEANEVSTTSTTSTTATFNMPSSDVYIMSCYFSSACSYQVALTKGAQTNGSFSLSESNGSYDNCDANFVVTVSSISPSSGYGCTGVTATGGNSSVTGPDGSGNYTVTYTKGNSITSTVTANFAEKVKTPTFGVSGGTYNATQSVTLSCATDGATIYYTTDGSTPTTSSSVYSSAISVTTTNTTIKAIAAKSSMANSDVASATYVIKCATPEISPVTGTYTGAQDVTITCATAGASIYYTNNGGTPSSSSTSYSAFSVDATKTIKAIAIKSGWTDSEIATSTITVQYGITWKVNGETWTPKTTTGSGTDGSSLVNSGTQWSALTLPTDPDPNEDGCGQKFIGWITNTITGELDKTDDAAAISALDILNSGNKASKTSETITSGTTFHAVFADYAE